MVRRFAICRPLLGPPPSTTSRNAASSSRTTRRSPRPRYSTRLNPPLEQRPHRTIFSRALCLAQRIKRALELVVCWRGYGHGWLARSLTTVPGAPGTLNPPPPSGRFAQEATGGLAPRPNSTEHRDGQRGEDYPFLRPPDAPVPRAASQLDKRTPTTVTRATMARPRRTAAHTRSVRLSTTIRAATRSPRTSAQRRWKAIRRPSRGAF